MEGVSYCLDFDPIHQSDWLGVYLGCAESLHNFDHCGKKPCSIIPSSVILSEAMWATIHLSLTPSPPFCIQRSFTTSIHLPLKAVVCLRPPKWTDGKQRKRICVQGSAFP